MQRGVETLPGALGVFLFCSLARCWRNSKTVFQLFSAIFPSIRFHGTVILSEVAPSPNVSVFRPPGPGIRGSGLLRLAPSPSQCECLLDERRTGS
ncbi:hypothetical protein MTO96_016753 [Rhipicephalus appendiculatus]